MSQLKALIVGGGIGGMATAIRLAEDGHDVELIDLDADWRVYGAGITITGPTLRAYKRLGLLDQIKAEGAVTNAARIFRYDGTFLRFLDEPVVEEGLPATGGIMRPTLHRIMQRRVGELAVAVRLGLTVDALNQDPHGVRVSFSDGTKGRYDLVVGADSIASKVRKLAFSNVEPTETGQACWRISIERPPDFSGGEFYLGHKYPVGITACGPDNVYLWLLSPHETGYWFPEEQAHDRVREVLRDFGGNAGWIRDHLTDEHFVNYRPLAAVLQPLPWVNGRIVLIGDAAHATTPHLASGAGMAVEDALVLAEELGRPGVTTEKGLDAYSNRRFPRCRHVVETSLAIGRSQLEGAPAETVGGMIGAALHKLAEEY